MENKIKQLFADNSMPKMVLLNGAWGSGKTYWVENHLLEPKDYIYLSLNGLASIDDFYSNLISKFFLNKNISATNSSSFLDGAQQILGNFNSENKGLISGLVSGFKGVAVTKAISSIQNKIIVLDDLERIVNSNFAKEIIGICQSLSEKNTNLKFIFATNISELKFENIHSVLEKNFAGIVEFKLNKNDFLKIIKENIQTELEECAVQVVEELDLKNIRIIKRAKNKYLSLINELEQGDLTHGLDILKGRASLLSDVIKIYFMQMEVGCDSEKIKSQTRGFQNFNLPDLSSVNEVDRIDIKEDKLKLPNIESTVLIDHIACSQSLDVTEVLKVYYPVKVLTSDLLLQRGVSVLTEADNDKIKEYVKQLINIISESEPELLRWFYAIDILNELDKYNFIEEVKGISIESKPFIDAILEQYMPNNFKSSIPHNSRRGYQRGQFHSEELNQKFDDILIKIMKQHELETIKALESEIRKGWTKEVDMKMYKEYRTTNIFSSFENHHEFAKAVKDNWTVEQVYLYSDFITDRYKANLTDWLMSEYDFLKGLERELCKLIFKKSGIKAGMINLLIETINKVLFKMDSDRNKV